MLMTSLGMNWHTEFGSQSLGCTPQACCSFSLALGGSQHRKALQTLTDQSLISQLPQQPQTAHEVLPCRRILAYFRGDYPKCSVRHRDSLLITDLLLDCKA